MFSAGQFQRRFDRVECDLSDVLGTPGLASGAEVASLITDTLRSRFESLAVEPGLYLRSVGSVKPFAAPVDALRATASAVRGVLAPVRDSRDRASGLPTGSRAVSNLVSPSAVHQLRVQTVAGHRVIGGAYRVHADRGPALGNAEARPATVQVTGNPIGDLAARDPGPPPPGPRRAAVLDAMRAQLGINSPVTLKLETVLFPMDGGAVWAYLGKGPYRSEDVVADLRIVVRADDLSLLVSRDASSSATLGEASVYPSNPLRDTTPTVVRLPDLTGAELSGNTIDVSPYWGARPTRTWGDWRIDAADRVFDDASAYYHLSRAAQWFRPLVGAEMFRKAPFTPLTVVTGTRPLGRVATFFASDRSIEFEAAPRAGARSADICIHEFTHAVVWAAHRLDELSTPEAQGLNEGYADYAQASMLDNPLFGDWVNPAGHRDCSDPAARFPSNADGVPFYEIGTVWAAVLWDLRSALGVEVADALAFNTIFYLDETSPLASARTALLDADTRLFPADLEHGRHHDDIAALFDQRLP